MSDIVYTSRRQPWCLRNQWVQALFIVHLYPLLCRGVWQRQIQTYRAVSTHHSFTALLQIRFSMYLSCA